MIGGIGIDTCLKLTKIARTCGRFGQRPDRKVTMMAGRPASLRRALPLRP